MAIGTGLLPIMCIDFDEICRIAILLVIVSLTFPVEGHMVQMYIWLILNLCVSLFLIMVHVISITINMIIGMCIHVDLEIY